MKKLIRLVLVVLPTLVNAQSNSFSINGTINEVRNSQKVYLHYRTGGKTIDDSTTITNGSYRLDGLVADPVLVRLSIGQRSKITDVLHFYVEKASINIKSADSLGSGVITGSRINEDDKKYKELMFLSDKASSAFRKEYRVIPDDKKKDKAFMNEHDTKLNTILDERRKLQETFIRNNPSSFISLFALQDIIINMSELNVGLIAPLYDGLSSEVQSTNLGKQISGTIKGLRRATVGNIAPDFTQNDINGKPVSLRDFRGKYVLIDFWASWCVPCRAENPNLVRAYHQYKARNFTVLGVSLDAVGSKKAWLKAIKADGLEWTQVSDLKSWKSEVNEMYGISTIPMNFLIDPTGKIIGKDLRGDELNKKLNLLFN